jgi:hypothetical protein
VKLVPTFVDNDSLRKKQNNLAHLCGGVLAGSAELLFCQEVHLAVTDFCPLTSLILHQLPEYSVSNVGVF